MVLKTNLKIVVFIILDLPVGGFLYRAHIFQITHFSTQAKGK